jgi:hypothetical protein
LAELGEMPKGFSLSTLASLMEKDYIKTKTDFLKHRIDAFLRMFKNKSYEEPDDLFFAIEDLPLTGKEYWFMHFCVPDRKDQVVLTFGRALDEVSVNKTNVDPKTKKAKDELIEGIPCAAVCWAYSEKAGKDVVIDSKVKVNLHGGGGNKLLHAKDGNSYASISGKYPNYHVSFGKGKKTIFEASISKPTTQLPYEIVEILKPKFASGLGAIMVNYYFDFEGRLHGKKIKGSAYLQKVVAALPLTPWNWVRIEFEDGSAIDFFAGKPFGENQTFYMTPNQLFFEHHSKRNYYKDVRFKKFFDGEQMRFLLFSDQFYLVLKSYALQPFIMKSKTTFSYDEYLVEVMDFGAIVDGELIDTQIVGKGSGIVEDAKGYLF